MKKKIAVLLSTLMAVSSINVYGETSNSATREYVISEFVQAVGRNNFATKSGDISSYDDVSAVDDEYKKDIEIAVANGIVSGYSDNTIKPDNLITRAEAAVILSRCIGNVDVTQSEKHFTDVPQWALADINKLTQGGVINGYNDTTFGSSDNITVEQVGILTSKIEVKVNKNNYKNDYYKYFNDKFLRNNTLENGVTAYDNFDGVSKLVSSRLKEIVNDSMALSDNNSLRINNVYNLYMDTQSRNSQGIESLRDALNKIDGIKSVGEIPGLEAYLYKETGFSPLFNYTIVPNPEDSSKNIIQIGETAAILNRANYFELETQAAKNSYYSYVSYILELTGTDKASDLAKRLYDFEKTAVQKSNISNYESYNVVCKRSELNNYCTGLNAVEFLDCLTNKGEKVNIYNSEQLKQVATLVSGTDIEVIKAYYKANIITFYGAYLTEDIAAKYYGLYNSINGNGNMPSIEDRAVGFAKNYAGSALTNAYAARYYDSAKEQGIKTIINDIKSHYKVKIENNTWLSTETKKEAVSKLDKMTVKVGYFKGTMPYSSQIKIVPKEQGGTLMGNVLDIEKIISTYYCNLPDTTRDKSIWALSSLIVNACYVPNSNEIIIPMAILEKPFFDENGDYYENLGAIGSIVAHEISHAFDTMGSSFDAYGNYRDWWTEEDKNYFYDLADKSIKYFGKYEVVNGIDNDGLGTVYENMSDLSGMSCICEITKAKGGNMKTVMESYAKMWSQIATDSFLADAVKKDPHSANFIRVNAILSSLDEFYETYDISESDDMYIPPDSRIKIW